MYKNTALVPSAQPAPTADYRSQVLDVIKANKVTVDGPDSHIAVIKAVLRQYCADGPSVTRGPSGVLDPLERLTCKKKIVAPLWYYDDDDFMVNNIQTGHDIELNTSVMADMFRRAGYETPQTSIVQQATAAGNPPTLTVQLGAGFPDPVLVPAFLMLFYQSAFNNLGNIVGNVQATLLGGGAWDSQVFDVIPLRAGKFLALFVVPFKIIGAKLYPSLASVSATSVATMTLSSVPNGLTGTFIALTSTHQAYEGLINRIAQCPGVDCG